MNYSLSNIDINWDRWYKGYYYEMLIQDHLASNNVEFVGNPTDFYKWKKVTNTDYDLAVKVNDNLWLKVECKLTLKRVFDSWFYRDWYTRDCDIIVTTDENNISISARNMLYCKRIALIETYSLYPYIKNIRNNEGVLLSHKGMNIV